MNEQFYVRQLMRWCGTAIDKKIKKIAQAKPSLPCGVVTKEWSGSHL